MNTKTNRLQRLTRFATRENQGIEIAPFFNPATSKADGYNVLILDISPTDVLQDRALKSEHIPDERVHEIENVDIVGDASRLSELLNDANIPGDIHYIISSHNFEHLPNPIKFLRGCSEVLTEGGVVSMAIPDYRACFDHFRFPTRLSDWIRAYREDISAPDADTILDYVMNKSTYQDETGSYQSGSLQRSFPDRYVVDQDVERAYELYLEQIKPDPAYTDVHCTASFGATFELMVRDLVYLGLLDLEVVEVTETVGHEYFVHLKKSSVSKVSQEAYYKRRAELMREVDRGLGPLGFDQVRTWNAGGYFERPKGMAANARRIATLILGHERVSKFRVWNRKRRLLRKQA
ncbi:MAG: adenine phosphoribosyltransferase [Albidovulum sp.]